MYLHLVELRGKINFHDELRRFFDKKIRPKLNAESGCRFSCIGKAIDTINEFMTFILWEDTTAAQAFETEGRFAELLAMFEPYMADSQELRTQVNEKLQVENVPVPEKPVVTGYRVIIASDPSLTGFSISDAMHVRIVTAVLDPEHREEMVRFYSSTVIPTLGSVTGFKYAFLFENPANMNSVISLTAWTSGEEADAYEQSGLFQRLLDENAGSFSELYRWKLGLSEGLGSRITTSDDPSVRSYDILP